MGLTLVASVAGGMLSILCATIGCYYLWVVGQGLFVPLSLGVLAMSVATLAMWIAIRERPTNIGLRALRACAILVGAAGVLVSAMTVVPGSVVALLFAFGYSR